MRRKKTIPTSVMVALATIMVLVLPFAFLLVSFLFQSDVTLDKPRLLEELAKSAIAAAISLTTLVVSNTILRVQNDRKVSGLRYQCLTKLDAARDLMSEIVNSPDQMGLQTLKSSGAEEIRQNNENVKRFTALIESLNSTVKEVSSIIVGADLAVTMHCSDYLSLLADVDSAIGEYTVSQSDSHAARIKKTVRGLRDHVLKQSGS